MTAAMDLREDHAAIVRNVLCAYLPRGARAYVFGSRAHGGARQYSDLDLALEWDRPFGLDIIGQIAEALSESDLPFKVDIVDLSLVDPAFKARIAANCSAGGGRAVIHRWARRSNPTTGRPQYPSCRSRRP